MALSIANGQVFTGYDITQPWRWRYRGDLVEWVSTATPPSDYPPLLASYLNLDPKVATQKWCGKTIWP